MSNDPNQYTFLLRIWQADDGSWRILLQNPSGGQPEGFSTIDDLHVHLKELMDDTLATEPSHRYMASEDQASELTSNPPDNAPA